MEFVAYSDGYNTYYVKATIAIHSYLASTVTGQAGREEIPTYLGTYLCRYTYNLAGVSMFLLTSQTKLLRVQSNAMARVDRLDRF